MGYTVINCISRFFELVHVLEKIKLHLRDCIDHRDLVYEQYRKYKSIPIMIYIFQGSQNVSCYKVIKENNQEISCIKSLSRSKIKKNFSKFDSDIDV